MLLLTVSPRVTHSKSLFMKIPFGRLFNKSFSRLSLVRSNELGVYRRFTKSTLPTYIEVKASPHKGLGAFATQDIPAFTPVLFDAPLISLGPTEDLPHAFEQYQSLTPEQRTNFLQFHSFYKPERDALLAQKLANLRINPNIIPEMIEVSSIFTSNAFNLEDGSGNGTFQRAIFPMISRINHSCVPNAHTNYDPRSARMALYSLSSIAQGQEIEISYFNLLLPTKQRQEKAAKWGFQCSCPACGPDLTTHKNQHEARRESIRNIEQDLIQAISGDLNTGELENCILKAQEMVTLVSTDESLRPQLPIAYDYVATFQTLVLRFTHDKALQDLVFENLDRAISAEADISGSDSPAVEARRKKKNLISTLM